MRKTEPPKIGRPRKGDRQVVLRMPAAMLERIDMCVTRMKGQTGLNVARAEVMRLILERGLRAVERNAMHR